MLQTRLMEKQVEEVRPCKSSSSFRRLEEGEGGQSVNSVALLLSQQHLQRRRRRGAVCDCPSSFKALEEQHPVHPPTVVVLSGFLSSNMLHTVDVNVNMREGIFK